MPKIRFCGAARAVTGSNHLLQLDSGKHILLDCGLYQGQDEKFAGYNSKFPYYHPADIDIVVLSHAHIDHIGRLPRLVREGFSGPIYCSHATRSLAAIMLLDSASIQMQEAEEHPDEEPLYNSEDVYKTMELFVAVGFERWFELCAGLRLFLRDAGHILGSASVVLELAREEGEPLLLGFTGDIGRPARPILKDPKPMLPVDYLLCESTYGDRLHPSAFIEAEELLAVVRETCVERKGKLLIPAFSVGRTQELIYLLHELQNQGKLPGFPIYIDSPLAINATEVFEMHPECYDKEMRDLLRQRNDPFGFAGLHYVRESGLAKRLAKSPEPCIIISAAGMMNAGRIKGHLFYQIEKEENTVLVISYCAPETLGHELRSGAKWLQLRNEYKELKARVVIMDSFSAHADKHEMRDFISNQKEGLKKLFLVHGEYPSQQAFAKFLQEEEGFAHVHIPELGEWQELS